MNDCTCPLIEAVTIPTLFEVETKNGISISYTKHHLEQHKDAVYGTTTINDVLPLIRYNLNDVKFQAHTSLRFVIQYTKYLHKGQGT